MFQNNDNSDNQFIDSKSYPNDLFDNNFMKEEHHQHEIPKQISQFDKNKPIIIYSKSQRDNPKLTEKQYLNNMSNPILYTNETCTTRNISHTEKQLTELSDSELQEQVMGKVLKDSFPNNMKKSQNFFISRKACSFCRGYALLYLHCRNHCIQYL